MASDVVDLTAEAEADDVWVCRIGSDADDSSSSSSSEPELLSAAERRRVRKQKRRCSSGLEREPFRKNAGAFSSQSSIELQRKQQRNRKRKLKPTSEWITALANEESSSSPSSVWEHRGKVSRKSHSSDQAENIQQTISSRSKPNTQAASECGESAYYQTQEPHQQHTPRLLKSALPSHVNGTAPTTGGVDWLHAFKPQSASDLGVHEKKKAELAAWFERARREYGRHPGRQKLLVISGPPGCGKSASLEVFAREFDFTPRVWSGKAVGHFNFKARNSSGDDDDVNPRNILDEDRGGTMPDFRVDYVSELTSFKRFVSECSRYQGLQLVAAASTTRRRPTSSSSNKKEEARPKKQLMVLEQLPLLHHAPTKIAVQRILTHFAEKSTTPGVLLFSDEGLSGGRHYGNSDRTLTLKDVLTQSTLEHPGVLHIAMNPVAPRLLRPALRRVAKLAAAQFPSLARALRNPDLLAAVYQSAQGDLRHAVNTLKFACTGQAKIGRQSIRAGPDVNGRGRESRSRRKPSTPLLRCEKNEYFGPMHVVGKLLRGKRHEVGESQISFGESGGSHSTLSQRNILRRFGSGGSHGSAGSDDYSPRGDLTYNAEAVIETCAFDAGTVIAFVQHNAVEGTFFDSIEDLSEALDEFSLLDTFANCQYAQGMDCDAYFPTRYLAAVGGTTVARTNLHPAKRRFNSVRAPTHFKADAARRNNWSVLKGKFLGEESARQDDGADADRANNASTLGHFFSPDCSRSPQTLLDKLAYAKTIYASSSAIATTAGSGKHSATTSVQRRSAAHAKSASLVCQAVQGVFEFSHPRFQRSPIHQWDSVASASQAQRSAWRRAPLVRTLSSSQTLPVSASARPGAEDDETHLKKEFGGLDFSDVDFVDASFDASEDEKLANRIEEGGPEVLSATTDRAPSSSTEQTQSDTPNTDYQTQPASGAQTKLPTTTASSSSSRPPPPSSSSSSSSQPQQQGQPQHTKRVSAGPTEFDFFSGFGDDLENDLSIDTSQPRGSPKLPVAAEATIVGDGESTDLAESVCVDVSGSVWQGVDASTAEQYCKETGTNDARVVSSNSEGPGPGPNSSFEDEFGLQEQDFDFDDDDLSDSGGDPQPSPDRTDPRPSTRTQHFDTDDDGDGDAEDDYVDDDEEEEEDLESIESFSD